MIDIKRIGEVVEAEPNGAQGIIVKVKLDEPIEGDERAYLDSIGRRYLQLHHEISDPRTLTHISFRIDAEFLTPRELWDPGVAEQRAREVVGQPYYASIAD